MISRCSDTELKDALNSMILSASGWRKVFAPDGEDGSGTIPLPADQLLAVAMGLAWGTWSKKRRGQKGTVVLVATDTRPTGPVIADSLIRGLKSTGCKVIYIGIAAAPEAMARTGEDDGIDAFAYISASHNPLGHNGIKFGLGGGVIGGADARELISDYRKLIAEPGAADLLAAIAQSETAGLPDEKEKIKSLAAYERLLNDIAGGPGDEASRTATLTALKDSLANSPVTIVADLNGSARCLSSDRPYLEGLGAKLITFNDRAGVIAHEILPEGESLEPCRQALESAHREDSTALIGYVPDNDGDRGNLVIWDESISGARALEAQEVFALSTLAEFACAAWGNTSSGKTGKTGKTALVVNGPTSHRVREIAEAYGAEVHEAEVGEANVVNRAAELRRDGFQVRLLGEGSNGGTITHPAEVRDPLNTITALLKLLRLPPGPGCPSPFEDWCIRTGRLEAFREGFGPAEILATLPVFTTTPASAERAKMQISTPDHGALKAEWEALFQARWQERQGEFESEYGIHSWIEVNNEGTVSRVGTGTRMRSGAQTGGLKIVFRDKNGQDKGFLWMRGSGTEPVFRIMAEVRGNNPEAEKDLIEWHRNMVSQADKLASIHSNSIP